jgi:hypothetical protein
MIRKISRRLSLKFLSSLAVLGIVPKREARAQDSADRLDRWDRTGDRVFLGGDFWANPMEDWHIKDGWAECLVRSGNRSIHSLTHQLGNAEGAFTLSVRLARPAGLPQDAGAGFKIGVRSDLNEVKSNCFASSGLVAGITGDQLVLGRESGPLTVAFPSGECLLVLKGAPGEGARYDLELTAQSPDGNVLGSLKFSAQKQFVTGNIALVSQFHAQPKGREESSAWRFTDWRASGDALTVNKEQRFGPILWTMYSLSDSRGDEGFVMKLTALTGPLAFGGGE